MLQVLGAFGSENTTFGDADFGWFGILLGLATRAPGVIGIIVVAVLGLAVFGIGLFSQKRLVEGNWDPTPHRTPVSSTAEAIGVTGAEATASNVTTRKYPKIAPPVGAPVPPARIDS